MVMEIIIIQMALNMRAHGKMIKKMDMGSFTIPVVENMKVNGKIINKMDAGSSI
jgi:hypothetical protein